MVSQNDTATSVTLLGRLHDADNRQAWEEFVGRYAPRIFAWCRQCQLQDSDAADVTQEVLYKLVRHMRDFQYDPARGSFRGWLKTVTRNAVRDLIGSWKHHQRGAGDTGALRRLAAIQDSGAAEALSAEVEREYQSELLRAAEHNVQQRVQPHTWQAYRKTAVDGMASPKVAEALNLPVSEVYVAKSRVLKMLRDEVRRLESLS